MNDKHFLINKSLLHSRSAHTGLRVKTKAHPIRQKFHYFLDSGQAGRR